MNFQQGNREKLQIKFYIFHEQKQCLRIGIRQDRHLRMREL